MHPLQEQSDGPADTGQEWQALRKGDNLLGELTFDLGLHSEAGACKLGVYSLNHKAITC